MKPSPLPDTSRLFLGTAGWSLPRAEQAHFSPAGSHLERYSARFSAVEINSSFHRSHRSAIWEKWRDAVPSEFCFSVKTPKTITHGARLEAADDLLAAFLDDIAHLEEKLGCLLVQLPPSLSFNARLARGFFEQLRSQTLVPIACEPRHASWFAPEPDRLLADLEIARVAADPARVPAAAEPGGCRALSYYRLHGSPKIYYSAYSREFLTALATRIEADLEKARNVWCIFDNTTLGAATRNALDLLTKLNASTERNALPTSLLPKILPDPQIQGRLRPVAVTPSAISTVERISARRRSPRV